MPRHFLILYPSRPDQPPVAVTSLGTMVERIGLMGRPSLPGAAHRHVVGEAYLSLITYLGCSPQVGLGIEDADTPLGAWIELSAGFAEPRLIAGDNAKAPRCPQCRRFIEHWRTQFPAPALCDCVEPTPWPRLNWRQCAGIARQFVLIHGVFEGEALPADALLNALARESGCEWRYAYWRGEGDPLDHTLTLAQ